MTSMPMDGIVRCSHSLFEATVFCYCCCYWLEIKASRKLCLLRHFGSANNYN